MSWYKICVLHLGLKEFLSHNMLLINVKFAWNGPGGGGGEGYSLKPV